LQYGCGTRSARRYQHVEVSCDQLVRNGSDAVQVTVAIAYINNQVRTAPPAECGEPLQQSLQHALSFRIGFAHGEEDADPALSLLCAPR
jgi:hypothetical protein